MNKYLLFSLIFLSTFKILPSISLSESLEKSRFTVTTTRSNRVLALGDKESQPKEDLIFRTDKSLKHELNDIFRSEQIACKVEWASSEDKVVVDQDLVLVGEFFKKEWIQAFLEEFEKKGKVRNIFVLLNDARDPHSNESIQSLCEFFSGVDPNSDLFISMSDGSGRIGCLTVQDSERK